MTAGYITCSDCGERMGEQHRPCCHRKGPVVASDYWGQEAPKPTDPPQFPTRRFIVDVAPNGFFAYVASDDGELNLFAASSAVSTFLEVCETMLNFHQPADKRIKLQVETRSEPHG